jgi:hypothetical protein
LADDKTVEACLCRHVTTPQDAIDFVVAYPERCVAVGIDTLTLWSTGRCGWRPADRWLQQRYPAVTKQVIAPASLYGAMALGGMSIVYKLRQKFPTLGVSETHPKVLYYALTGNSYGSQRLEAKTAWLASQFQCSLRVDTEHELDAAMSAFAAWRWLARRWTRDLHSLPQIAADGGELVRIAGESNYPWPEDPLEVDPELLQNLEE